MVLQRSEARLKGFAGFFCFGGSCTRSWWKQKQEGLCILKPDPVPQPKADVFMGFQPGCSVPEPMQPDVTAQFLSIFGAELKSHGGIFRVAGKPAQLALKRAMAQARQLSLSDDEVARWSFRSIMDSAQRIRLEHYEQHLDHRLEGAPRPSSVIVNVMQTVSYAGVRSLAASSA